MDYIEVSNHATLLMLDKSAGLISYGACSAIGYIT